jgi:hypothetical protein
VATSASDATVVQPSRPVTAVVVQSVCSSNVYRARLKCIHILHRQKTRAHAHTHTGHRHADTTSHQQHVSLAYALDTQSSKPEHMGKSAAHGPNPYMRASCRKLPRPLARLGKSRASHQRQRRRQRQRQRQRQRHAPRACLLRIPCLASLLSAHAPVTYPHAACSLR